MKKKIAIVCALITCILTTGFTYVWTDKMNSAHEIAEKARAMGLPEDNPIIVECQRLWWEDYDALKAEAEAAEAEEESENEFLDEEIDDSQDEDSLAAEEFRYTDPVVGYTENDIDYVASVIYNESADTGSERMQELVGAVLCNRVRRGDFPVSVYECVTQPRQYLSAYATYGSYYMNRAMNDYRWEYFRSMAIRCLEGYVDVDPDVVYQANFTQGNGLYEVVWSPIGTMYFCYG